MKLRYSKYVLFDTGKFVLPKTCLVTMDSRSDFQILQCITITMIYRLFIFMFRCLIVLT